MDNSKPTLHEFYMALKEYQDSRWLENMKREDISFLLEEHEDEVCISIPPSKKGLGKLAPESQYVDDLIEKMDAQLNRAHGKIRTDLKKGIETLKGILEITARYPVEERVPRNSTIHPNYYAFRFGYEQEGRSLLGARSSQPDRL